MCCNNFGYFTNIMSQMMLPMLMIQSMRGGRLGQMSMGCQPFTIFPQSYSTMPTFSSYSFMPTMPYMNTLGTGSLFGFGPTVNYASTYGGGYSSSVGNYFDFLNSSTVSEKAKDKAVEDKKYYVNTDENGVKRKPFEAFEAMEEVIEELGYEKAKKHSDRNSGVQITDDAWRADAEAKKDDVEANYMAQVKAFGKEFIKGIDTKHGNADGVLTYAEFEKYQAEDIPADADEETKAEMQASIKTAFNRLNLNGGETIDEKEMTAFLAAMDYDKDSNVNGIITVNDFTRSSVQLGAEGENSLDALLKDRYKAFFDTNA